MALVLMGGWIRSRIIQDEFFFRENNGECYLIASGPYGIAWIRFTEVDSFGNRFSMPFYQSKKATDRTAIADFRGQRGQYRWEWGGIRFCKGWQTLNPIEFWCLPYWSLTIPLTLVSAYLILWKPRTGSMGRSNA